MIFKKIILIMVEIMLSTILNNDETDCEKYKKLEIKDVPSIKKSDLPPEFCDEAFIIVDEFIRKTRDLNYEILLYFDYETGDILKCKIGETNKVQIDFEDDEFGKHNVASIHNHPKSVYTPPSPQNFSILVRNFEDYELIAGWNGLWILKGKLNDEKLYLELKIISKLLFEFALKYSKTTNTNVKEIENICDDEYGKLLSKYINNKNINEIQITKKEYPHD